jgi:hypothetical protein
MEYQGEQVYRMLAQNVLALRMLIDQITPHLPKDNEEVNVHVKCLKVMLDATSMIDLVHGREDRDRGHELDHQQSPHGDSASSITPRRSTAKGMVRTTVTCGTSSTVEIHAIGSKIAAERERESVWNKNSVMRGAMIIMPPTVTNLAGSAPGKRA